MDLARFLNGIKILHSLDYGELSSNGVQMSHYAWRLFSSDPEQWLMRASNDDAKKVWALIEARQPKREALK